MIVRLALIERVVDDGVTIKLASMLPTKNDLDYKLGLWLEEEVSL